MSEKYELIGNKLIIFDEELNINLVSNLEVHKKSAYHFNKKLFYQMYYHDDILHGPSIFYNKQGGIISIAWFFEGKRYGKAKKYYANGKLYSLERYFDDFFEEKQEYYFENGKIKSCINYKKGLLDGEVNLFYENENLKRKLFFKKGKKLQDNIFDEDENLIDEKNFSI